MNPAVLPQQLQGMQNQLLLNPQGIQQPPASRAQAGATAQLGAQAGGAAATGGAQAGAGAQPTGAGQTPVQIPNAPAEQVQGVLNFMDRNQFQTYMLGIKPLSEMDKFNGKEENLKKFLDAFGMKEAFMGWRNLFTITVNGAPRHIPTEWGRMTIENMSMAMAAVHAANA